MRPPAIRGGGGGGGSGPDILLLVVYYYIHKERIRIYTIPARARGLMKIHPPHAPWTR